MKPDSRISLAVEPRRILVRGVNWLGDAVMTAPALHRLDERWPEAEIVLLTHEKIADLWRDCPSLDAVLTFRAGESPLAVGRRLRERTFDTALVLPGSPRSALEVWLAGIPRRIGFARPWRNWFLTQALPPRLGQVRMQKRTAREVKRLIGMEGQGAPGGEPLATYSATAHHLHDYLHLVAELDASPAPIAPRLEVSPAERQVAYSNLLSCLDPGAKTRVSAPAPLFLGLNPSAAYGPAKRWPAERFGAVAREVSRQIPHAVWLLVGNARDDILCGQIAAGADGQMINLAGKTSLRQLMGTLSACRVVLTNDSGPMHLAAALGARVVVPFGSTSPELTGPGLPGGGGHRLLSAKIPCSPCFRRSCPIDFRCMAGISVERVVSAVLDAAR